MKLDFNIGGRKVGETFVLKQDLNALAGAGTQVVNGISKNCPVAIRVVDFWTVQRAAGPAASSTLQLRRGDGAASETFTAITDALAIGTAADKTLTRAGTIDDAQHVIGVGESLDIVAVASSGTHTATAYVLCMVEAV